MRRDNEKVHDLLCNHSRGAEVYEFTFDNCNMNFVRCNSYLDFRPGRCKNNLTLGLGLDLDPASVPKDSAMYFYSTHKSEYPYCGEHEEATKTFPSRWC
ncbi:hypothetical protein RRG08_053812 [Elysia crispata]|uniref:Uncharacterized protein n=1 Tax=Elysia crispata TaxID=231223 RepID=A0AAE1CLQ7_9GAST|nr:hypothetical protein RRG08_053812 [Elysia crispata]